MSREISIRKILQDVQRLVYREVITWNQLYQGVGYYSDAEHVGKYRAAERLSREFTKHVLEKQRLVASDEPEGRVLRADVYALTYEDLVELLRKAWEEGRAVGLSHDVKFGVGG